MLLAKTEAYSLCGGMGGPLPEEAVRISLYGGLVPTYFWHKSDNLYLNTGGICGIAGTGDSFNFSEQSTIPWTIGMDVGYVTAQYIEIFMGASYAKGKGKSHHFELEEFKSKFRFKSYSDLAIWGGVRFFFIGADLCGDCYFDPFLGFKAGVKFFNHVKADYTAKALGFFHEDLLYYEREILPALGVQLGFTFNYFDCVDVIVMGEAIWTGAMRNNNKVFIGNDAGPIQAISVGETGPVVAFPITVGLVLSL